MFVLSLNSLIFLGHFKEMEQKQRNIRRTSWWLLMAAILISMSAKADNITFADANVKALCVANWDTNKDGELSTEEAAAVTTLGTVFKGQTNITTFDELRYFTGVTAIGEDAFRGCSIGPTLTIPGTVKTIGNYAFNNCKSLTRITLQEGVESVGWHTFSGPISYLSLPSSLKSMSSMAVDPYVNADPSSGIFIPEGDLWVYVHSKTPAAINEFAFYYVFGEGHLVVPPGTIDAYKAEPGWAHFGEYLVLGDVNGDGAVNVLDVTTLVSYVLNEPTNPFVEEAADVNGDGNINSLDITAIVSIILNQD